MSWSSREDETRTCGPGYVPIGAAWPSACNRKINSDPAIPVKMGTRSPGVIGIKLNHFPGSIQKAFHWKLVLLQVF